MQAGDDEEFFYEDKWKSIGSWQRQRSPYLKKSHGIEGETALEMINARLKAGKILDLGCGGGRNTVLFAKKGFESYGIDFSESAVRLAKILNKEERTSAVFKKMNVLNLAFKDSLFDAVLDFGLFHHLRKKHYKKYLDNICRVLKSKGLFLLYTFCNESKETGNFKPESRRNWSCRKGHYNHYFGRDEIIEIFRKKFRILKIKTIKEKKRKLAFYITLMQKL